MHLRENHRYVSLRGGTNTVFEWYIGSSHAQFFILYVAFALAPVLPFVCGEIDQKSITVDEVIELTSKPMD